MMASPTDPPPPPAGALHDPAREGALPALACSNGADADADAAAASFRRFKMGVCRPPPGPRRTPDHPPYAEMIQVALRALAEDGGSTVDDISRRIAAVYLDLPWAHERLLPHYLGRLVAAGDVAVAGPGRYALFSPSSAAAGDANPNPNPCSQDGSAVAAAAAAAAVTPRSSSATAAAADNGEGERLGAWALAMTVAAGSSGGDGASQCDHSSMPPTAAGHGVDEERPSMLDPSSATAFVVRQNEPRFQQDRRSGAVAGHYACFMESNSSGKRGRGRPPLMRRGRGRPPKGARYHRQPASGTHISDPGFGCILLSKCEKGRPPNSFILSRHDEERLPMSSPSLLPRKGRGRPPKCKPTVVTSDANPDNDDVHLLNFGSSCDRKCIELDRNVHSSWTLGDGTSSAGGEVLPNCGAAPKLKVILRLPRKPECKPAEDSSTPDLSLLAEQVAVHVPKRPRTSIDHKPRKISTTIFEERVSNQPLVQSPEQMLCALPNIGDSSPNNIIRSQPRIEGWVQVLLAVQPTTKVKKMRQRCNKRKMVHPIVQFQPDNLLLSRGAEDAGQMDACLQTSLTKQSDIDGLMEGMVDENRAEIERCIQLISALNLDPNGSSQTTKEENLKHAGRDDEPMSNVPLHSVEEENAAHGMQGRQKLHIGHSVLDGLLQTGKEQCRTQVGGHIESLPLEHFIPANMEGFVQLLVRGLSKTEDSFQREETSRLHPDVFVSEPPVKQLVNKELESEPQDEGSIQEFPAEQSRLEDGLQAEAVQREKERIGLHAEVHISEPPVKQLVNKELENEQQDEENIQKFPMVQSRPEDDLQAEEVNESDSTRSNLRVLPKFGDDLQTEDMSEPPSVECLLACTSEQYALGDSLQSPEADNRPWVEGSVQELHVQNFKPLDDLQSEKNESDAGNRKKVLPHEQAKLQDDLPFEKDRNGEHALGSVTGFSAKGTPNNDSSQMHQLQEGSHDKLFNRKISVEQTSPGEELQTDCSNQLHAEKNVEAPHEGQPKLGVDPLNGADEHGSYAEGYVPMFQEKGPIHGNSLQAQEIERRPQDEESTQIIPMDEHPAEDELQRKDHVESHVDEHLQMSPQEQRMPGDDLQMDERSRAHAAGLVLLLPLEKSMVSDFVQMSESEDNTQSSESIEDASSQLSKPDDPLQTEETYGLHNDGLLQGPGIKQSKTYHPLQSKEEKNLLLKKNKKHKRRLWFEG